MAAAGQGLHAPTDQHAQSLNSHGIDLTVLLGLDPEATWRDSALCAQTDPDTFYPEKGGSTRPAKRLCGSCEVRQQCLDYALTNGERFGIWGGLSERERRRLRPLPAQPREPRPRRPAAIAHGTEAGYKAHRRAGEEACQGCRQGAWEARNRRAGNRGAA